MPTSSLPLDVAYHLSVLNRFASGKLSIFDKFRRFVLGVDMDPLIAAKCAQFLQETDLVYKVDPEHLTKLMTYLAYGRWSEAIKTLEEELTDGTTEMTSSTRKYKTYLLRRIQAAQ
jgi:hypothetical protein